MNVKPILIVAIIIHCIMISIGSHSEKLYPIDEASKNESFLKFRNDLIEAVERKDWEFLLDCIDDEILVQPGYESHLFYYMKMQKRDSIAVLKDWPSLKSTKSLRGKEFFEVMWSDPEPITGRTIWNQLKQVLELGGTFTDSTYKTFRAPYVWSAWPKGTDYDGAVIADSVFVYVNDYSPKIKDTLSYDLIYWPRRFLVGGTRARAKIIMSNGKSGYVQPGTVRDPLNYGAEFSYRNNRWLMCKFTIPPYPP
jgi:hypothetical protein